MDISQQRVGEHVMKAKSFLAVVLMLVVVVLSSNQSQALMLSLKLPFSPDQEWGISTGYGGSSTHEETEFYALDFNIDGTGDLGLPIIAAAVGTVQTVTYSSTGFGNSIIVDHGSGWKTRYSHLQTVVVTEGESVAQGQKVGTCGSTGNSTGPHLHFTLYQNGVSMKPEPMSGYTNFVEGGQYTSDNAVSSAILPGQLPDGTINQRILDCYNEFSSLVGNPYDNGGSAYVHDWQGLTLQDFIGSDGNYYAIIDSPTQGRAFLLMGGIRWYYLTKINGPALLGAPVSNEYVFSYYPYLNCSFDYSTSYVTWKRQDFESGDALLWRNQLVDGTFKDVYALLPPTGGGEVDFTIALTVDDGSGTTERTATDTTSTTQASVSGVVLSATGVPSNLAPGQYVSFDVYITAPAESELVDFDSQACRIVSTEPDWLSSLGTYTPPSLVPAGSTAKLTTISFTTPLWHPGGDKVALGIAARFSGNFGSLRSVDKSLILELPLSAVGSWPVGDPNPKESPVMPDDSVVTDLPIKVYFPPFSFDEWTDLVCDFEGTVSDPAKLTDRLQENLVWQTDAVFASCPDAWGIADGALRLEQGQFLLLPEGFWRPTRSFTLEMVLRLRSYQKDQTLLQIGSVSGTNTFLAYLTPDQKGLRLAVSGLQGVEAVGTTDIRSGQWVYLALAFDASLQKMDVFVNGYHELTHTYYGRDDISIESCRTVLAASLDGSATADMDVDAIRFSHIARSTEEIKRFAQGAPLTTKPAILDAPQGVVWCWNKDGPLGSLEKRSDLFASSNATLAERGSLLACAGASGHPGFGYELTGQDACLALPTLNFTPSGQYSLEALICTSQKTGHLFNVYREVNGGYYGLAWYLDSQTGALTIFHGQGFLFDYLAGKTNVCDGAWHHVVAAFDGTTVWLYVDGELDKAAVIMPPSFAIDGLTRHIGAINVNGTLASKHLFQGRFDGLRLWDKALSLEEVKAIFDDLRSLGAGSRPYDEAAFAQELTEQAEELTTVTNEETISSESGSSDQSSESGSQETFQSLGLPQAWSRFLMDGVPGSLGKRQNTVLSGPSLEEVGGPAASADQLGNVQGAYALDGQSQFLKLPVNAFTPPGPHTIALRLKAEKKGTYLFQAYSESGNAYLGIACYTDSKTGVVRYFFGQGAGSFAELTGTKNVCDSVWHQVVFVFDGAKHIYLDGVLDVSQTANAPRYASQSFVQIGAGSANGSSFYAPLQGSIDSVQIWDVALSADEVMALYQLGE